MLSAVDQEAYFPAGKRSAFSPPPVIPPPNINPVDENPPMNVDPAADPILAILKKSKIALTSFKRNQTAMKQKAAARTSQALQLTDAPFAKVDEADRTQPPKAP